MTIDWFTIIAQIINFIILMWLMKRFLYKPILNSIKEREKMIAETLSKAESAEVEASKLMGDYGQKMSELDRKRAEFLQKAREEAESEKLRLLDAARIIADDFSKKKQESLLAEETALRQVVSLRIEKEVIAISRKALSDLAGVSFEEQLASVFIQRLRELDEQRKGEWAAYLNTSSSGVTLRTALEYSREKISAFESSINGVLGTQAVISYEFAPKLIGGIELVCDGRKIAWNVADYLYTVEEYCTSVIKLDSR